MEIVENILSVIGLISLIVAIVRIIWILFGTNVEWFSDVKIIELLPTDYLEKAPSGERILPQVYEINSDEYSQVFLFMPSETVIKKMKLVSFEYDDGYNIIKKKRTIKEFRNITPLEPLVIRISVIGIIPRYSVQWEGGYGIKMEYVFQENGRDGNEDSYGMSCKIGFWPKVRRIIGLK